MKNKLVLITSLVIVLALLLSACQTATPAPYHRPCCPSCYNCPGCPSGHNCSRCPSGHNCPSGRRLQSRHGF